MNKYVMDLINLIVSSGLASYLLFLLKRWLDKRIHNQKLKAGLDLAFIQAKGLVAQYANSSSVPIFERKQAVIHDLSVFLDDKGHTQLANDTKYIEPLVERAYQLYKSNDGDVHDAKKVDNPLNPAPVATNKEDDKK